MAQKFAYLIYDLHICTPFQEDGALVTKGD